MKRTYRWINGVCTDITDWKRAPQVFPAIISDHMAPLMHPVSGETYDSKSAFRAATRAAGMVEMGNDAPMTVAPPSVDGKQVQADLVQAFEMVEQGYVPLPSESIDMTAPDLRIYE